MKAQDSPSGLILKSILGGVALLAAVQPEPTTAAVLYWDPNGASAAGSGTWNTTNNQWAPTSALTASPGTWVSSDAACFCAGTGTTGAVTVTVNSAITCAGIFNGALTPPGCTLTLSGSGSLSLLAGNDNAMDTSGSDGGMTTIAVPLTGSGVLAIEGADQLFLNAANTYSGGTTLGSLAGGSNPFSSVVNFNNGSAFGSGPINFTNCNGCAMAVEGAGAVTITNAVGGGTNAVNVNIVGNPSGLTFSGPWTLNKSVALGVGNTNVNNVVISGVIGGSGSLGKYNAGMLTLSGANTYTGSTSISNGNLSIGADGASGGAPGNLGAVPSSVTAASINLAGGTLNATNTFALSANRGITLTANSAIGVISGKTLTYTGIIAGAFNLMKTNTGTLILGGNHSTYSGGTIINSGTLQTGGDRNLGADPASFNATNITLGGGTLQGNNPNFSFNANRGVALTANSGLSALSGDIMVIPGAISQSGGTFGFNVNSSGATGTVKLTGTNTYAGSTTISAGTLALAANGSIDNSLNLVIGAGATFDVSAISSGNFNLSANTILTGNGTGTTVGTNAANINGPAAGAVNLGPQQVNFVLTPTLFTGDPIHPPLNISQGGLMFNGNTFFVTNSTSTPLGVGNYNLIRVAGGNVSGTAAVIVGGGGVASNTTPVIGISGNTVVLQVQPSGSYTGAVFSALSASQSVAYGSTNVPLSGTVGDNGPMYFNPTNGETVTVIIDGNAQNTTINDGFGDFSLSYNPATIPVGTYAIKYSYAGNPGLGLSPAIDTSTALTVSPAPATIGATAQSKTYGQTVAFGGGSTNFTSSGLLNGETVGSVTLAVSGNGGAATAVPGTYAITPSAATGGTFSPINYTITYVTNTLTVSAATLNVIANNLSLPYGVTNPFLSVSYTNFVNGQSLATSDVHGSPALSTTTNGDVGVYVVTNLIGTLTSTNYTFALSNGTLTVTNAVSTNVLAANPNPALPGTTVLFTAALGTEAPSVAVPTGAVQFLVDGSPSGPAVALSNGVAQTSTSVLTHGYHVIAADFPGSTNQAGLTNILGSTNSVNELINAPPVAGPASYGRQANVSLSIPISGLLTNASDADGDAISLTSVGATSTNGATITTNSGSVIYAQAAVNPNVTDSFNYTVADIFGATNTGTVLVTILSNPTPVTITGATALGNGAVQLNFAGVPGFTYLVEAAANLNPPVTWFAVSTNVAATNGIFSFIDLSATNFTQRYYRTATP